MVRSGEMDRWVPPDRVVFCGKHDTQLVAARSLHQDPLDGLFDAKQFSAQLMP
jgi:hypothetical protein